MKNIFLITFFSCIFDTAFAFEIKSIDYRTPEGAFARRIEISCAEGSTTECRYLCGQDLLCVRDEPYCLNCAGTASLFLRNIFNHLTEVYVPTPVKLHNDLILNYLKEENYLLFDWKVIFNFYAPPSGSRLYENIQRFCPDHTKHAALALLLDSENRPRELSFVLCQSEFGITEAYAVEVRRPELLRILMQSRG